MRVETLPLSEHAVLTAYLHSDSPDLRALEAVSRPAIIICPGGRYAFCADVERDTALAFLKKESIVLDDYPKGYVLICFQNVALGWVKNLGNRSNNLYPQSWKIRMNL